MHKFSRLCAVFALLAPVLVQAGLLDKLTKPLTGIDASIKACNKGRAELCTSVGRRYRSGSGVKQDLGKAGEYLGLGCIGGDADGCHELYSLGFAHLHGKNVAKDTKQAVALFAAGCNGDGNGRRYSGAACQELARLYLNGDAVERDATRGVQLLDRACAGGSRRGCRALGDVLLDGKLVTRDIPAAVDAYDKACSGTEKETRACATLGRLFQNGDLIERDVVKAERYLTDACTFPNRIGASCYQLARLYESDLAGTKSAEEIAELYHVACHRADSDRVGEACVAAAEKHLRGEGVDKDENWVAELYSRGCQLKHKESCRRSCAWHCDRGQPHACAAVAKQQIPVGVANCFRP